MFLFLLFFGSNLGECLQLQRGFWCSYWFLLVSFSALLGFFHGVCVWKWFVWFPHQKTPTFSCLVCGESNRTLGWISWETRCVVGRGCQTPLVFCSGALQSNLNDRLTKSEKMKRRFPKIPEVFLFYNLWLVNHIFGSCCFSNTKPKPTSTDSHAFLSSRHFLKASFSFPSLKPAPRVFSPRGTAKKTTCRLLLVMVRNQKTNVCPFVVDVWWYRLSCFGHLARLPWFLFVSNSRPSGIWIYLQPRPPTCKHQ